MKNTMLVKYIGDCSELFKMNSVYEVVDGGRHCYVVDAGPLSGFLILKANVVRVDLPEDLFKWESEG